MTDETTDTTGGQKSWIKRLWPLALIAIGLVAFFALGGPDYISMESLRENREALAGYVEANFITALLGFIAVYAILTAISFPGAWVMSLVSGFLFGVITGTVVVVVAATIGATAIFLAARYAFGDLLRRKADGSLLKKFEKGLKKDELSYLFILRLIPVFPFFIVNIAPAFFDVKLRNYVLSTFFGIIPGSLVYVSVGNGIGSVFDSGEEAKLSGLMFQPSVILPIIGLIVLALIPVIYKRVRGKDKLPAA